MSQKIGTSTTEKHVFLAGRPPIEEYFSFFEAQLSSQQITQRVLMDDWRAANDHVIELEVKEAGWADNPTIYPLPSQMEKLKSSIEADPIFQKSMGVFPTSFGMVELDRLVVFQKFINLEYVDQLKKKLESHLSDEEFIFKTCLPLEHNPALFNMRRTAGNAFTFISPSTDLRHLDLVPLAPSQIVDYQPGGIVIGTVGLVVGFGANYLNALLVVRSRRF